MTKEHALPAWTSEAVRRRAGITNRKAKPFIGRYRGVDRARKELGEQVRDVCRECNTGWLANEIEGPAIVPVSALIVGDAIKLTDTVQAIVARWAYKTALNLDRITVRPALPLVLARDFFQSRNPSDQSTIDLAAYVGTVPFTLETVSGPLATMIAFSVGAAVFRVTWLQPPHVLTALPLAQDEEPRDYVRHVHPGAGLDLTWPPNHIIQERDDLRDFGTVYVDGQKPDEEQLPPR